MYIYILNKDTHTYIVSYFFLNIIFNTTQSQFPVPPFLQAPTQLLPVDPHLLSSPDPILLPFPQGMLVKI